MVNELLVEFQIYFHAFLKFSLEERCPVVPLIFICFFAISMDIYHEWSGDLYSLKSLV